MGFFVRAILVVALLVPVAASADPTPAKTFEQWVAMAEAGDPAVDYTALRQAYVTAPGYDGYGSSWREAKTKLIRAASVHDCTKIIEVADAIRKADFTYPLLHLSLANCYTQQGDRDRGQHERAIYQGLTGSLLHSGDGKSVATAYVVVTLSEEYFVLAMRGLEPSGQALIHSDGHAYDRLTGANPDTGEKAELYFNVDAMFGSLERQFGGHKQEKLD